ncbi:hypothetical protein C0Q70_11551 [Pomacea canaliculata]|uniref:PLAT domain-containing protein n=1 Tax=Pomacea canaliculata TaxID=400727 RepID=A0A2T7P6A4_POMCA|nr:hypothetical protein C0Q70_11551 [Pomacea canaliculata]
MESNAVVVYRYNYITLGSKVVTLECSNAYSHSIVQVEVFVTNQCFSPDPIFDRQYSKQAKPMTVLNSEPAKLVTRTVIKCTDIKPNFTWAIKVVKNDSILPFEYPHLDYLTWERGQLEPDLYRFSLNISFGREHDFCWLSEMIYVRVERAPLVADIQGGTRKTGDPHAIVDARTGSYDRIMGYGNNEGLAFTWSCRTYNSTSVQELLSLESAASPGSSVPCDRISTEIEAGKRQLNISDDVQSMGFLFEVAVSYDDLTSNATAHVQFIRGSLNTEIVCILNCGMKVAVSSKLVLNVTCDRCTQEPSATVIYVWKIFKVDNSTNGTKVEISDTNIFEKTDTSIGRGAVIKENALEGGQTYRVEVNVTLLDDHSNGFAAREFRTNCPPWGGNCTVTPLQGNVMTDSFSMACTGWKDEGFSEDANSTSDGDEESLLLAPLIYKFLLRRYNTIFPIAQGGESKMPRIMLPYIPGPNNSEHELVARIYDPWNDFIEVSQPIKLYANDSSSSLENTLEFWYGQVSYTNRSSNLEKQMKSLTIASSLISTFVTDYFISMVRIRGEDAKNLSGHGLTALAEGLSMILLNPATTSPDSLESTIEVIEMATESLRTMYTTKPYPIFENLKESISAMTALLDRIIAASVPSYHIADGRGIVFNSSDISEDDKNFIQESLGIVSAIKDQEKIKLIKKVLPKLEETLHAMYDSLLAGMVVSQVPETVERGGISLMASKMTGNDLNNSTIVADPKTVLLEIKSDGDKASDPNSEVVVKATVYTQNPYAWSSDSSSYNITSPVVRVDLQDNNGTRVLSTLSMTIKRGAKVPLPSLGSFLSNDTRGGFDNLLYHRLHDYKTEGEHLQSTESELELSSDDNTTTFKFLVPAGVLKVGAGMVGFYVAESNETFAYKYLSFTDSCHVWDENNHKCPQLPLLPRQCAPVIIHQAWPLPAPSWCRPTLSTSSLFSPKFDPNNASVYGTLIGLLLVWVLGVVWARRQDKKDKEKWLVGYLKDNLVGENYLYLLTVHTGLKRGSGTKSSVSFVLGGSHADSGIRVLSDGKRTLETGSVMKYIMTAVSCLGHLDYVRIWHDNSGGYQAGWFLSRLDVEDLQSGQRYLFMCERWLAVDKDNGVVDRVVPLAQQDEIMSFDRLFSEYTKIGITAPTCGSPASCVPRPAPSRVCSGSRVVWSCCC